MVHVYTAKTEFHSGSSCDYIARERERNLSKSDMEFAVYNIFTSNNNCRTNDVIVDCLSRFVSRTALSLKLKPWTQALK